MKMRKILTIILSLTAMVSCFDADIHNTEHPATSELQVMIDVPDNGTYTIVVGGQEYSVVDGEALFTNYFAPGVYNVYAFNSTSGVSVDCTADMAVASVETNGGAIISNPEVLYFGAKELKITADDVVSSTMTMEQVTAQINFELTLKGGAFVNLKNSGGIEAKLTGVAQQWDCVNRCCYGESGYAEPALKLKSQAVAITRADDVQSIVVEGSMKLLGLDSEQVLSIILNYKDGSSNTIAANVTPKLATLNGDKSTPINLSGEYEAPLSGNITGGVIDWNVVDESGNIVDIY